MVTKATARTPAESFDAERIVKGHHRDTHHTQGAVKVWAAIGAVAIAVIACAIGRWIFSADFVATPRGSDEYPFLLWLRIVEVFSALFLGYFFMTCTVLPWTRNRRLSFDGMLFFACLTVQFIDPIFNYFSPSFIQNAYSVNRGSWANFIPGWASPSAYAGLVEGLIWALALYGLFGVVAAKVGCWMLAKLRARYPTLGSIPLYSALFVIFAIGDFIVEYFLFVHPQIYIFWGAWSPFTLWAGQVDQFPLYETLLAVIYALGFVWLRDSRDDEGRSFVERGVNKIKVSQPLQTAISFSALTGFSLVWAIVSYFGPFIYTSIQADSYPHLPSYLRGGAFCGTENTQPCPSQYLRQQKETYITLVRDKRSGNMQITH